MGKKKAKKPKTPDYAGLAEQQAGLNQEAMNQQTVANRPNQINPSGSQTWSVDPTTGQWTQTVELSPELQAMQDQMRGVQYNALNTYGDVAGTPLDTSWMSAYGSNDLGEIDPSQWQDWGGVPSTEGMQDWGQLDMSGAQGFADPSQLNAGFGGVKEVQQAMMGMLQPGLDQRRAAETQRLKSQGLTEGSRAWQTAMQGLSSGENEAANRAMLSGVSAYNDVFGRQLQQQQLMNATRGQQFGEQLGAANYANALRGRQLGEQFDLGNYANQLRGLQGAEAEGLQDQGIQTGDYYNRLRQQQMNEELTKRQLPMQEMQAISQFTNAMNPTFNPFTNAGNAGAADIMGAANQKYQADMNAYNAQAAANSAITGNIGKLVGSVAGSFFGPLGTAAGGALGGMLGGAASGGGAQTPSYMWQPDANGSLMPVLK